MTANININGFNEKGEPIQPDAPPPVSNQNSDGSQSRSVPNESAGDMPGIGVYATKETGIGQPEDPQQQQSQQLPPQYKQQQREENQYQMPNLESLGQVLESHRYNMRESQNMSMAKMRNVSTAVVEDNVPFDSENYSQQYQASAGQDEYLKLTHRIPGAVEPLNQWMRDFNQISAPLRDIRMPNTRVNIKGKKVEGAHVVKEYAEKIDQRWYLEYMSKVVPIEMMDELMQHCLKANQADFPALWLNQALDFETQENYVHAIRIHSQKQLEYFNQRINEDVKLATNLAFKDMYGEYLYGKMESLSYENQTSILAITIILISSILANLRKTSQPVTATSIWKNVTTPSNEKVRRPDVTADWVEQMKQTTQRR